MRRRQRIEVRHVILPFAVTLVVAVGMLCVYTFLNPSAPEWIPSSSNSFGYCDDSSWELVVLAFLLGAALSLALWEAYKTKHLPEDISDSGRVWQTLLAHFVILLCKDKSTTGESFNYKPLTSAVCHQLNLCHFLLLSGSTTESGSMCRLFLCSLVGQSRL